MGYGASPRPCTVELEHVMAGRVVAGPIPDAAHVTHTFDPSPRIPNARALTRALDRLRVIRFLEFDDCAGVELESGRRDGICAARMIGCHTGFREHPAERNNRVRVRLWRNPRVQPRTAFWRIAIVRLAPRSEGVGVGTLSLVRCALLYSWRQHMLGQPIADY